MKPSDYYGDIDVASCPQHREVKILANKFWHQWRATGDKLETEALNEAPNCRRIERLSGKCDLLKKQFDNCRRGVDKCCGWKPITILPY